MDDFLERPTNERIESLKAQEEPLREQYNELNHELYEVEEMQKSIAKSQNPQELAQLPALKEKKRVLTEEKESISQQLGSIQEQIRAQERQIKEKKEAEEREKKSAQEREELEKAGIGYALDPVKFDKPPGASSGPPPSGSGSAPKPSGPTAFGGGAPKPSGGSSPSAPRHSGGGSSPSAPKPAGSGFHMPRLGGGSGGGPGKFGAAMAEAGSGGGRSKFKIFLVVIIVFLFLFTGFGIIPPPAAWALGSGFGYVSSGEAAHDAESLAYGEQSGISKAINDWQTAYRRSMMQATGQSIEGNVEKVEEFVGIKFDKPWVENARRINFGESVEVSALFEGYNPKGEMTVNIVCTYNEQKAFSGYNKDIIGGNVVLHAGETDQWTKPDAFKGERFQFESITCRPKFPSCGNYVVYLTGQSDNLRVDSHLSLYYYDDETLKIELEKEAMSKNKREVSASDIPNMLSTLHPEIQGHSALSESEKGPAALFMLQKKMALVPYRTDEGEEVKLWIAIENRENGAIADINSVTIVYPDMFRPVPGTCDGWDLGDRSMTLKSSSISSIKKSMQGLKRGIQRLLPSCYFKYSGDPNELKTSAKLATWYGSLDYNYIIQTPNTIEVRNTDGTVCKKKTGSATSVSASSSSTKSRSKMSDAKLTALYLSETKKLYGDKGTHFESADLVNKQVTINKVLKDSLNKISYAILSCDSGKEYFQKNPTIVSGVQGPSIYHTGVPSLMSFGAAIKIVSTGSTTGQSTADSVKTDIPSCVISAFKNNGWDWGGDYNPRDPSLFEHGAVYKTMGV